MPHARVDASFHLDCWGVLHEEAQASYRERTQQEGLDALLSPYSRVGSTAWLTGPAGEPIPERAVEPEADGDAPAVGQQLAG